MPLELETEVVFLYRNKIFNGIISEIRISRSDIIYELEYLDDLEFFREWKTSKEVYANLNELFNSLRNDFENKKEWEGRKTT